MQNIKSVSKRFILIGALGLLPVTYLHADHHKSTYESVKQETKELIQSTKEYSVEKKDELVANTKMTLDKIDREIEEMDRAMEEKWDKLDDAARNKYLEEKRVLKQFRGDVAQTYRSLKDSSADAWDETKEKFSESMEKLYDAWESTVDYVDGDS